MHLIILAVFSFGHFVIDLASGMAHYSQREFFIFGALGFIGQTLWYNAIAFGVQPLLGFVMDRLGLSSIIAVLGCVLTAVGLLLSSHPGLSIILAALGNALYHLGCGAWILRKFPGKAWPSGVFVGPGALGIYLSRFLGQNVSAHAPAVVTLIAFIALLTWLLAGKREPLPTALPSPRGSLRLLIVVLLLGSTLIRSYIGLNLSVSWKQQLVLMHVFVLAMALGKMAGGFAADKLGRFRFATLALLLSAPLLSWLADFPPLASSVPSSSSPSWQQACSLFTNRCLVAPLLPLACSVSVSGWGLFSLSLCSCPYPPLTAFTLP